jgi:hypothetical protein
MSSDTTQSNTPIFNPQYSPELVALILTDQVNAKVLNVCESGNVEKAKWFKDNGANFHFNEEKPFLLACEHLHTDLAKWIYSFGTIKTV